MTVEGLCHRCKWQHLNKSGKKMRSSLKFLNAPVPKVYTNGNPYGIAEDIVFSMPCRSKGDGNYELVPDVSIDDFLRERIRKTEAELLAEKRCVAHLTGEGNAYCDLPEDTMLPGEQ